MRRYLIELLAILLISSINSNLFADNYEKHAKEIRDAVWNWDIDAFKNHSIPEKYKYESAVVLARHQQIEATSKNKFRMYGFFVNVNREVYYTNIDRIMIMLNDKKALDEYSELSFKEEVKSMGFFRSNKIKTVVGARIIKPDGTIREIDVDEDAVAITEGKKDKEAFKKLAIKGLETGDILDYFYSEEMELETLNIPPQTFMFFPEYPTLSYSVECVLGPKLTVEYRAVNGAPDFVQSVDDDKNTVLKVSQSNLEAVDGINDMRWLSIYRDLPMIRLMILNNSSRLVSKPASARKSGVYKDVSYEEILKDKKGTFAAWAKMFWMGNIYNIYKKVNKAIENYKQKNTSVSDDDLALYIYDALRFYWPNDLVNYPYPKFFMALEKTLKENDIECKICFTTNRFGPHKDHVVENDDLSVFLSANNNKQLFFYPNDYRFAGEKAAVFEGETASAVSVKKYKQNAAIGIEGTTSEFEIPNSSFEDNKSIVKSYITFSEQNPLELEIKRTTVSSGEMKDYYLKMFALYEDWDKVMRKRLLIETDFWQDIESDKSSRKYAGQYQTLFEDKRKEQKEWMQTEFKIYHSTNSGELISYSIKSMGATIEYPVFEFETAYTIDGLVKKAGNDLLFDAGKLIGIQWTPTEKERIRNWDAYLSTPMSIENEIIIEIPRLYTIEGIEKLNKNIDNQYGEFTSSATIDGNKIRITASKIYKQNFVPKNDWNTLLEMIDMTNDFYSQSIILKYNN
ncbi:MAG: DUF3857 domain-containing protein [Tannerellaceae bacterium]|jgi:hypothetical protein|nr:DUF3857 domain-containing protein [Tannerellaceae bacterium]